MESNQSVELARQQRIASWFDATYASEGLRYLRPFQAYPIYTQLLELQPGQRLLDVACGAGHLLEAAHRVGASAVGVDLSGEALRLARTSAPKGVLALANSERLPFQDACFHRVTCIGSLERFLQRTQVLAEVRRVARDDARFCFMVRNAEAIGWRVWRHWLGRQNHAAHQDAQSLDQWKQFFLSCGFSIRGVYMDQWFRQKLRHILRGFRHHDFERPEPVARPLMPLRFVYEYIFLLEKA